MTGRFGGILRRRLRPFMEKGSTVEEIVSNLRSTYPDYSRIKQQTLTTAVQKGIASLRASNKRKKGDELPRQQQSSSLRLDFRDESEEELRSVNLRRKKKKKFSQGEKRLQQMEVSQIRSRQRLNNENTTSEDGDDHEEKGEDLSTSEDAIYEKKVEPEFDLMKGKLTKHSIENTQQKKFGMDLETGFLLFGPPGCGKTLIAKAVANEAGANFIHIKASFSSCPGPELLNKYVGESELAVRTLFQRASTCAPCILFFDEVDALTKRRGAEGGWVVERLLTQLLIELDGADHRRGVFVIGATNRIESIDSAILRPGRFGKLHYVPLPSQEDRALILQALSMKKPKKPLDPDVDLNCIAQMEACKNLSGADLRELMNEAAMVALEDEASSGGSGVIKMKHFEHALSKISPSVSEMDIKLYEKLAKDLKAEGY
ncbi:hypothetical protein SAY86_028879 [Trapa natans]|uniref:AAA+ ATPase domain-containing protein n=1 Tax=Trapa natans TaxID=22666 RepID=A0AAN7MJP2_TRANT|nr:hypothetical protein SAY86_028879 [Trapa natans]